MTGLVLAGGCSRRMGRDKALLTIGGRRLVDVAVAALAPVCVEVLVASGDRWIERVEARRVADAPGEGPLAGIAGALRAATTPLVAVIAADMPCASGEVLARLAASWTGEAAVAPLVGGVVQPLHAVYASEAADGFSRLLSEGERSPRAAIDRLGGRVLGPGDYDPQGTAGAFWTNVNSPADLRALRDRRGAG